MNSWVTFEAAARLQSFKAGGEELNITSSAVAIKYAGLKIGWGLNYSKDRQEQ
jgi:DNA-binding transcriptional LysR family regulator